MTSWIKDGYNRFSNVYTSFYPPPNQIEPSEGGQEGEEKPPPPLRMGILGASNIAPIAVILPCKSHPGIMVTAVAARDKSKAISYSKKHGIPHVFDDYQSLIQDDGIDVIYNALPNALHHRWTLEAIKARKHVLLEKPSTSNREQTEEVFEAARQANVVVLEAFHYRFHPALHEFAFRLHSVLSPLNPLVSVKSTLKIPGSIPPETDIRFNYDLGGGATMDTGCYTVSSLLYTMRVAAGTWKREKWEDEVEVREARPTYFEPRHAASAAAPHLDRQGHFGVDEAMQATLLVPSARPQKIACLIDTALRTHLFTIPLIGWKVPFLVLPSLLATFKDGTTVEFKNFVAPFLWHSIITTHRGRTAEENKVKPGTRTYSKAYVPGENSGSDEMKRAAKDGHWAAGTGKEWWSTYRYQLEAFVRAVQKVRRDGLQFKDLEKESRGPQADVPVWVDSRESEIVMRCIDSIYEKAGMSRRP